MLEIRKEVLPKGTAFANFTVYCGSAPAYIAVQNKTPADLYICFGTVTDRGNDAIYVPPKTFMSLAVPNPDLLTVFWEYNKHTMFIGNNVYANSITSDADREIYFYFSDQAIQAAAAPTNPGSIDYQVMEDNYQSQILTNSYPFTPKPTTFTLSRYFGDRSRRLVGIINADQAFTLDVMFYLTGADNNSFNNVTIQTITATSNAGDYFVLLDQVYYHNIIVLRINNTTVNDLHFTAYLRNCPI